MLEVSIPLRRFGESESTGTPEDYLKIIQDEYASRYLDLLGIASTAANKAAVMRCRPLDDCEVHGIWVEGDGSKTAEAIKIRPPLRQRIGDFEEVSDVDKALLHHWYGSSERICVRPPDVAKRTILPPAEHDDAGVAPGAAAGAAGAAAEPAGPPANPTASTLEAEFERVRQFKQELKSRRCAPRAGGAGGAGAGEPEAELFERMRQELDPELLEHHTQELASLKAKFILPFACERPRKEGSQWTLICPWPTEGPLDLEVPETLRQEALRPVGAELEDVRKNTVKWVSESLPLEMLTSRRDERMMKLVRAVLQHAQVFQLTGLLAHLTYWLTLGAVRREGEYRLAQQALQSLYGAVQEAWSRFEKAQRDSHVGVSLVLPCLMLTLKRGIERCFEAQYPSIMAQSNLHQQVVDRINTLLMRLFDPDCFYARFGKFDGTGKAITLTRKLDMMASARGHIGVKRLHGRAHRATPLVQSVMRCGEGADPEDNVGKACDARTRAMLARGKLGGAPTADSVVPPPQDGEWRRALLKAAMERLSIKEDGVLGTSRGGAGPGRRRRHPDAVGSGRSAPEKASVPTLPPVQPSPRARAETGSEMPATAR